MSFYYVLRGNSFLLLCPSVILFSIPIKFSLYFLCVYLFYLLCVLPFSMFSTHWKIFSAQFSRLLNHSSAMFIFFLIWGIHCWFLGTIIKILWIDVVYFHDSEDIYNYSEVILVAFFLLYLFSQYKFLPFNEHVPWSDRFP